MTRVSYHDMIYMSVRRLPAGYYTEPIPFDATPADLKYTLESISNVGTVHVGE